MSVLSIAPDIVADASGNLEDLGSALRSANAAAASQTTAIAAPAADEVSATITALFGAHAQEFQALSAKAAAFHDGFVNLLNGGAAQYLNTEIANAQQTVVNAVNTPAQAMLGQPLIGTGQWAVGAAAANPAASGFRQWVSNELGQLAASRLGSSIYNATVALEAAVSGTEALTFTEGGGEVGTLIGGVIGGAIGSFIGPEGTVIGAEIGAQWGAAVGLVAGTYGPGLLAGEVLKLGGVGDAIGSEVDALLDGYTNVGSLLIDSTAAQIVDNVDSSANNLAVDINSLFGTSLSDVTGTLGDPQGALTQLSNWPTQLSNFQLGPSFTMTSDVTSPYGVDGTQQNITGVYTLGAGPFGLQVGSFQGNTAADLYGGHAVGSATIFGFTETDGVYETPGGAPQFTLSESVSAFGLGILSTPQFGF